MSIPLLNLCFKLIIHLCFYPLFCLFHILFAEMLRAGLSRLGKGTLAINHMQMHINRRLMSMSSVELRNTLQSIYEDVYYCTDLFIL